MRTNETACQCLNVLVLTYAVTLGEADERYTGLCTIFATSRSLIISKVEVKNSIGHSPGLP